MTTFEEQEFRQKEYIEYLGSFKVFHQPAQATQDDRPSPMQLVPVESQNEMESLTWYMKMVTYKASGGDLSHYDKLYNCTDWAEVYELYVLRTANG